MLSDKGEFEGVVAADVSLKALNDFVGKIHLSEHGRAFIIESDGSLIASTGLPNIRTLADGKWSA